MTHPSSPPPAPPLPALWLGLCAATAVAAALAWPSDPPLIADLVPHDAAAVGADAVGAR